MTLRNQYYGGEFSSHTLTNLIALSDSLKIKPPKDEQRALSDEENQNLETVACNPDLSNYYSEIDHEWSDYSLIDENEIRYII
jgi:hypothetical protein